MHILYNLADQSLASTQSIGIYNCSLSLAQELAKDPDLQMTILTNSTLPTLDSTTNTNSIYTDQALKGKGGRMFWDQWALMSKARHQKPDWLFLPKEFYPF